MKVAISIPDETFARAEAFSKRRKLSRSKVYARAVDEYVARHSDDDLTAMANALADSETEDEKAERMAWHRASAAVVLKNTEW